MSRTDAVTLEANRLALVESLTALTERVALALRQGRPVDRGTTPTAWSAEALQGLFSLSPFELDVVLLTAGVELHPGLAELVAGSAGGSVSFSLAMAVLDGGHWDAASPDGPLRRWQLVLAGAGHSPLSAPLRIDERVLHFLLGLHPPDARLAPWLAPLFSPEPLAPGQARVVAELATAWGASPPDQDETDWHAPPDLPVLALRSPSPEALRAAAAALLERVGVAGWLLDPVALAQPVDVLPGLVAAWNRETRLAWCGLVVEVRDQGEGDGGSAAARATLTQVLDRLDGPVLILTDGWLPQLARRIALRDLPPASGEEQEAAWTAALPASLPLALPARLARRFDLPLSTISALAAGLPASSADPVGWLWARCRERSQPVVDHLARRVVPQARLDDLVLTDDAARLLRLVAEHVECRHLVFDQWGFGATSSRGSGTSALFTGPSGTGKTTAAEALANELGMDLMHIDLSGVVSKYIGETEQNLRRVFDAAQTSRSVLLFDEADALFGTRSQVADARDRYANIEVSYLLQKMESFDGLAILATNLADNLDPAFERRLRFRIRFPFPDAAQRLRIWNRVFPPQAPLDPEDPPDFETIASYPLTGGSIRSVAIQAAVLAAARSGAVRQHDLLLALRDELLRQDRVLPEALAAVRP